MPCLMTVLALLAPRVAIVVIFLLTNWLQAAYDTWVWPVLGFILMPYTTLAYMAAVLNTAGAMPVGWVILIVIAVIIDLASWGGGYRTRRREVVVVEK